MGKTFLELASEEVNFLEKKDLRELARYNYGFIQVFSRIMQIYYIDALAAGIVKKQELNYNLYHYLLLMAVNGSTSHRASRRTSIFRANT